MQRAPINPRWTWLAVGILLTISGIEAKAAVVEVDSTQTTHSLGLHLEYLEDSGSELSLERVLSEPYQSQFQASQVKTPSFGFTQSTYWFQVNVRNTALEPNDWLLEIAYPLLDSVELYLINELGEVVEYKTGDSKSFSSRPIDHRNFVFPVTLQSSEILKVVTRITTTSSMQVPIRMSPPTTFWEREQLSLIVLGIFYGLILVMVVYNGFLYLGLRQTSYLYYVLHVVSAALFQACLHGTTFQWLWPDSVWFHDKILPISAAASAGYLFVFTQQFLGLRSSLPRASRALTLLTGLSLVVGVMAIFIPYSIAIRMIVVVAMLAPFFCLGPSIYLWRRGSTIAGLYVSSWFFFLLGAVLLSLAKSGFVASNALTENGFQIGMSLQIVLLSLALAYRLRVLEQEKNTAEAKTAELTWRNDALLEVIDYEEERLKTLESQKSSAIGELEHAQNQLIQAEKMSSLGQLVAGVAHDIASPVSYIADCEKQLTHWSDDFETTLVDMIGDDPEAAEVLSDFRGRFESMRDLVNDVRVGNEKLATLNKALRNYSRTDLSPVENVNPKSVIEDAAVILKSRIGSNEFTVVADDISPIQCRPSHLGQVLANLIANASDALEDRRKDLEASGSDRPFEGQIRVRAQDHVLDGFEGISIVVEDNGPGIPEALRDKVQSAFYTTKPIGKGTGLGLAICGKIIDAHSGVLSIGDSIELGGAAFAIWLPKTIPEIPKAGMPEIPNITSK